MPIEPQIVDHVARLARLELSEEERVRFTEQLNSILDYLAKLNELNTDNVDPTSHVIAMTNVLREDAVGTPLPRDLILASAPAQEDGFFKVPPILETESQP